MFFDTVGLVSAAAAAAVVLVVVVSWWERTAFVWQACIVAEAYSLNVNWGDILFDKAIKDGSVDYVAEMVAAESLTSEVFRAVVDRYVPS